MTQLEKALQLHEEWKGKLPGRGQDEGGFQRGAVHGVYAGGGGTL